MNNILARDIERLFDGGIDKIHVLTDFDGTLTKDYANGKKHPSIISVLRDNPGYLSPDYQKKAHELYDYYAGFEHDEQMSLALRKEKMQEWWKTHFDLLIKSGLNKKDVMKVANSGIIEFRDGAKEFLELMKLAGIPVVVLSAAGLGDAIPMFCTKNDVKWPNLHFISNRFLWDKEGMACGVDGEIVHSLNKDETSVKSYPEIFSEVKERVNVLLLGNSVSDIEMSQGFEVNREVSIGFVDQEESLEKTPKLKSVFSHVLTDEFGDLNNAIRLVLNRK